MKRHIALDLLQYLMDMAVQNSDRAKPRQQLQRLSAVACSPVPLGVHAPQGDMGEDHDRRALIFAGEVAPEPGQLVLTKKSEASLAQSHAIVESDEMHALVIEAAPAEAADNGALAVTLHEAARIISFQIVFSRHGIHLAGADGAVKLVHGVKLFHLGQV